MAINPINNQTTLRLMGMVSGMDTDSIIQQTLKLHQLKIDSQFRARTLLEWKQKSYSTIADELTSFRRTYLTMLGNSAMRVSSAYNTNKAELVGKNSGAVTVSTSVNSPLGTIKIGQVLQLAKNTSVSTTGTASKDGNGFKLSDKLYSLNLSGSPIQFDQIDTDAPAGHQKYANVSINGANVRLYEDGYTNELGGVDYSTVPGDYNPSLPIGPGNLPYTATGLNGAIAAGGGYQILDWRDTYSDGEHADRPYSIVNVNGKDIWLFKDEIFESDGITEKAGLNLGKLIAERAGSVSRQFNITTDGKSYKDYTPGEVGISSNAIFQVGVNGKTITLNMNMTINEMMDAVNSSGTGATMRYDQFADQFTIESNSLGSSNMVVWGFEALGISSGVYNNGQTAKVEIEVNGVKETIERPRNTFDFRGVSITLNYETKGSGVDGAWDESDNITVSIKRDVTEPLEKIKAFIDSYNTIISKLESLIKESKNASERTYLPLTDEEKAVMSEKQIADWEEIAKKGILRNDSGIQNLTNSLRGLLFEKVTSAGLTPSQIGLTTGLYKDNTGGQIILDEEKLKAALESEPDRVMNVFMGGAEETTSAGRGLLWRMDDMMSNYVNGSQFTSIANLENSIKRTNEQMEKLQKKMWEAEDKLYKQFAAMETALSKIQSQTDWMTAMLTSMNNSK
ncbi:MAG: flagellar filament capping protein FliD [Oscillospiraceae bacterium]|nr:flagellar filament capping protein FliD [Oscillospiraceae bacterium]